MTDAMNALTHRYQARLIGQRLLLVDVTRPQRIIADFTGSELPPPLTAAIAERCARVPQMTGLLIETAAFFGSRPKTRRKAGGLPDRIMALLRDLELDGWVT
jgi:hypothetical protein